MTDMNEISTMEPLAWNELPTRLGAFTGLIGFTIAVLNGMIAGNEPAVILLRAVFAMVVCWCLAWLAGFMIMKAVSRDDAAGESTMEILGEDPPSASEVEAADTAAA